MTKYHAKKTEVDGITFDSKKEAGRYQDLKLMQKAGLIQNLRLQVKYVLLPKTRICGRHVPEKAYIADFVYQDDRGKVIVEDVKGMRTPLYMLKRHLMKYLHGVEIQEV
jgi:hypothetical protein